MSHRIIERSRASGFSLLEVLIAVLVLSFGLLGMAGLQAAALQGNRDARLQSAAVNLAREMAEMMRGNKRVALQPSNPYLGHFDASPLRAQVPGYCLAGGGWCATEADIAAAQLTEWLARVDDALPGARVSICRDSAPYGTTGLPQWPCTAEGADDMVVIKIGWSRRSTDSSKIDAAAVQKATASDAVPSVVLPVTAGLPKDPA